MADLCKRGHEFTPENTITEPSGRRRCRTCRNAYKRRQHTPSPPPDRRGPANPMWKGAEAGYSAMHKRVAFLRGKAVRCERCGDDDPTRVYDWANLTGCLDDPSDYEQMCRSCHRRYDLRRRMSEGPQPAWTGAS